MFSSSFTIFIQRCCPLKGNITEFDHFMLKCNMVELKKQTIAHYLGGLKPEISNIVQLSPYWSYKDVCRLALKIETQQKRAHGNNSKVTSRDGTLNPGSTPNSKPNPNVRTTPKTSSKSDGTIIQKKITNLNQC